jgi:hypothetical protein
MALRLETEAPAEADESGFQSWLDPQRWSETTAFKMSWTSGGEALGRIRAFDSRNQHRLPQVKC